MSGKREKTKNDTWGEKELSKHIGKSSSSRKPPATYGSPKTQPKERSSRDATKRTTGGQSSTSSRRPDARSSTGGSHDRSSNKGQKSSHESSKQRDQKNSATKDSTAKSSRDHRSDSTAQSRRTDKPSNARTRPEGRGQSDSRQKTVDPRRTNQERSRPPDDGRSKDRSDRRHTSERSGGVKQQHHQDGRSSDHHRDRKKEKDSGSKARDSKDRHQASSDKHKKKEDQNSKITVHEEPPVDEQPPQEVQEVEVEDGGHGSNEYEGNFPQQMVEVTEELAMDDYEYEEEFEEYDEDFEEEIEEEEDDSTSEDSGSEEGAPAIRNNHPDTEKRERVDLVEIMQAIDAENQSVALSSQTELVEVTHYEKKAFENDSTAARRHENVGVGMSGRSPSRMFVDFSSAQQKEVDKRVARKTRKRGQELLSMIELDIVSFDLFDLPPLSEYEVYVKKFGADDTRQVSVQTGEDNMEGSMQTDPIATTDKWVQWPPEDLRGYGGGAPDDYEYNDESSSSKLLGESALHLVSFLKRAGQVCSVLLEENLAMAGQSQSKYTQSQFPFCSTKLQIQAASSSPLLSGRHVNWVYFSPTQEHLFLASYSPSPVDSQHLAANKGIVCLWSTREPAKPHMILGCESTPTCCCLSPQKSSFAFAGNEDGSVVLWDLREPLSMHTTPGSEGGDSTIVRVPTFSTAGIPQLGNHQAPIVSITPLSADVGGSSSSSSSGSSLSLFSGELEEGGTSGLSFQLATLDRSCKVNMWVLVELLSPDPHGSESDLGLVPGGRVKLVKSTSIDITSPLTRSLAQSPDVAAGLMQAYCLQFQPQDTNHLYIGTDTGCVYHHTRYGRRPIPRCFLPTTNTEAAPCEVLSISFSQRQPNHFLVGCSDGSLRLHYTKRAVPLLCWPVSSGGVAITHVQWVEHCQGVFLVQDAQGTLYMWDLVQKDAEPVFKQTLKTSITCCKLSSSVHYKSPVPTLTLAFSDGTIEIHQMKDLPQTNSTTSREQSFEDYLSKIQ